MKWNGQSMKLKNNIMKFLNCCQINIIQFEDQPCLFIAFIFALGVLCEYYFCISELYIVLSIISLLIVCITKRYKKILFCSIFLLGMWRVSWEYNSIPNCSEPCLVRVRGIVTEAPWNLLTGTESQENTWNKSNLSIQAISILQEDTWQKFNFNIQIRYKGNCNLQIGDMIELLGWLESIKKATNPYEKTNYMIYYAKKIFYTLTVDQPNSWLVLQKSKHGFYFYIDKIRKKCAFIIQDKVNKETSGLLLALLLGIREHLPSDMQQNFRTLGIVHLLAISGMHIIFVVFFFWYAIQFICYCFPLRIILIILICWFYAMLSGLQVPIIRATILLTIYFIRYITGRQTNSKNTLSFAGLIILCWHPLELFNASFQLSFFACYSLIQFYSICNIKCNIQCKKNILSIFKMIIFSMRQSFLMSWSVFCGTILLISYHFYAIYPLSFLWSTIFLPFVIVLILGTLLLLFSALSLGWIGSLIGLVLNSIVYIFSNCISFCANFSYNAIFWIPPLLICVILFYCLILFCTFSRAYLLILLSFICLFSGYCRFSSVTQPTIYTFNVGHGNMNLIQFPNDEIFLYDCGSMNYNAGNQILLPFLAHKGIKKIHGVVLSHYDSDHYNALYSILGKIFIETLYINETFYNHGKALITLMEQYGCKITIVQNHDIIEPYFQFFNPEEYFTKEEKSDNEHSLFLQLATKQTKFLFTGDAGKTSFRYFLKNEHHEVDYFQVPHHGSKLQNTKQIVKKLKPKYIILSAMSHFPSDETLAEYKDIPLYATYQQGAIITTLP